MDNGVDIRALELQDNKQKVTNFIKDKAFDVIAYLTLVAMTALTLGVFELRELTVESIITIFLECIPFYLSSVLLGINYYTKGTFAGKKVPAFMTSVKAYSEMVASLTGEQLGALPDFCDYYNREAIVKLKSGILRGASIPYASFDDYFVNDKGKKVRPLKITPKKELIELYGKESANIIERAKHVKVKGLYVNILLGSYKSHDDTDIGDNEKDIAKKRKLSISLSYLFSTIVISVLGVKDMLNWGWTGLLLTVFKLLYIFARSYLRYYDGFNDITLSLSNHISRKCDILKEFFCWYNSKPEEK